MGSVVSALTGSGAKKAAGAQAQSLEQSIRVQKEFFNKSLDLGERSLDLQEEMYDTAIGYGLPYRAAGANALATYESLIYGTPINQTSSYQSMYQQFLDKYKPATQTTTPTTAAASSQQNSNLPYDFRNFDFDKYRRLSGRSSIDLNSAMTPVASMSNDQIVEALMQEKRLYETGKRGGEGSQGVDVWYQMMDIYKGDPNSGANTASTSATTETTMGTEPTQEELDAFNAQFGSDVTQAADFTKTPGYEFRRQEGEKALERSAAANSGLLSGATLKATERYGQDYATNEYSNFLNRVGALASQGATMAQAGAGTTMSASGTQAGILGNIANTSMQAGQNIGGAYSQIGAARASGYLGEQAAGTNLINTGAQLFGMFSDRKLKENIKKVGTENGFNIYEFNYKGNSRRFIGVMADEVERVMPQAVKDIEGNKAVDYKMIGVEFREVA